MCFMGLLRAGRRLSTAVVLGTTEDDCTVFAGGERSVVPYFMQFPRPRAERVAPGHLVAIARTADGIAVVWRWFDAVVLGTGAGSVTLWEPGHGLVNARPRDQQQAYQPGTRAYLSAGLPGSQWWVSGPVPGATESADVDIDEVAGFLTGLGVC
jgi:hypothetical protein